METERAEDASPQSRPGGASRTRGRILLAAGMALTVAFSSAATWRTEEPEQTKTCFAKTKKGARIYIARYVSDGGNAIFREDRAEQEGVCLPKWDGHVTGKFRITKDLDRDANRLVRAYICTVENPSLRGKTECLENHDSGDKTADLSFYHFSANDYPENYWLGGSGLAWQ